jgi:hypothetical protein
MQPRASPAYRTEKSKFSACPQSAARFLAAPFLTEENAFWNQTEFPLRGTQDLEITDRRAGSNRLTLGRLSGVILQGCRDLHASAAI